MTGAHDPMGRELILRAHVATQTKSRTFRRVLGGIHPSRQIICVFDARLGMTFHPALASTMTGLTTNAVIQLEFRTPFVGGHIVSMTIQSDLRRVRRGQTHIGSDAF